MKSLGSGRQPKAAALIILTAALSISSGALSLDAAVSHGEICLQSDLLTIRYQTNAGTMEIDWKDGHRLKGLASSVQLANGQELSSTHYTTHTLSRDSDAGSGSQMSALFPGAREYTIRNSAPGMPDFLQHIWLWDGKPQFVIQAELTGEAASTGTRHFDVVVLKGSTSVQIGKNEDLRVLHVPFDNDMWFRYNSMPVQDMKPEQQYSSDEVTAIYDNKSRQALILGSVTHETWKTAIDVQAQNSQLTDVDIYGGISSPNGVRTDTHDTVPHGVVHGDHVFSPAVLIASFGDWRDGLEAYGQANAEIHPPLAWPEGRPMGWNSWAAYGDKINEQRYLGAAQYLLDKLVDQGFGRKVIYINLDAFWSNLDTVQLADAAANVRAMHGTHGEQFEPGIYWTPFAYWSDDLDAYVEGTGMKYRYRDILLKAPDGAFLPKVDGGRPIDPSHPGTKMRTAYYMRHFEEMGFKYLKLDFLSHGTLEGAHYDPAVQTGVQAYNLGMDQIVEENHNQMFLSLSIAPLFPSGYGHARRLSCDTKGHISGGDQSTEYMLNSLTYGWWTDKNLYFADPDHVVLGEKADQGARSIVEGKSRLLSAVISGGMILDSSRLADDTQGQELAAAVYNNRQLFEVASEAKVFRPVEGDTGSKAANVFVRPSTRGFYVAVFNFDDKNPQSVRVPLRRLDSKFHTNSSVSAKNVASGAELAVSSGELIIQLQPSESQLIEVSHAKGQSAPRETSSSVY